MQGDPGAGKTTLALQFLLEGIRQGELCLYIALSESIAETRTVAESHGWDVSRLHIHEFSAADHGLSGSTENTLFLPSEIELFEATRTLLDVIERTQPARVVLDSLSELRLLSQDPLRYRRQILSLKEYFRNRRCTAMMLDDCTVDKDDRQLHSLAHGVISLENMAPDYGAERRRLRVLKLRGRKFRGGFHDFIIERGGLLVFPRLIAAEHRSAFTPETLPSGVPELDCLLGGGVDRGTSILILGPAGVGKSAITTRYALSAAERGENVALFLFDENRQTMLTRSASLGMNVTAQIASGRIAAQQIHPAEMCTGEFITCVRQHVEERQVRLVLIDSLNGYLKAMPAEQSLSVQLHELLAYLAQKGVTAILVVAQAGIVGNVSAPIDVSYLADTVLLLRYFEAGGAVHKAISVVKKRSGFHENTIRQLSLSSAGISVGAPLRGFQGVLTGVPQYVGEVGALFENLERGGK